MTHRTDSKPATTDSTSSPLAALVRLLARQAASEWLRAGTPAATDAIGTGANSVHNEGPGHAEDT